MAEVIGLLAFVFSPLGLFCAFVVVALIILLLK